MMNKKEEKKWYSSPSNWVIVIVCILLVPILLINVSIMIQSKFNKDKVPSVFGIKPFIVLSESMEVEIFKGDLILTKVVEDPESLEVGDIIAFRDSQETVTTHRIIDSVERNSEKYFITKGDNNSTQDQNLVSMNEIEGIYMMRIPFVGNILNSLSEPATIIILVLGITVIFGIGFIISNKKQQALERENFLEYKRKHEESKNSKTKKTKSIKAEEDDELLEEDDYEEEEETQHKKTSKKTKPNKKA